MKKKYKYLLPKGNLREYTSTGNKKDFLRAWKQRCQLLADVLGIKFLGKFIFRDYEMSVENIEAQFGILNEYRKKERTGWHHCIAESKWKEFTIPLKAVDIMAANLE